MGDTYHERRTAGHWRPWPGTTSQLSRVVICLGELAARDPGGRWANRPANSLTTILLPWLPQTCAPVAKRVAAVATLLAELPDIGWKLLLSLLPQFHSSSSYTRRPTWRDTIPDDWPNEVSRIEYIEQAKLYSELAVNVAKGNRRKLAELINHLENFPPTANEQLLAYLGSDAVLTMAEAERLALWTELLDLVARHRKFSDTEWAMQPAQVNEIAALADRIAPTRLLFVINDFSVNAISISTKRKATSKNSRPNSKTVVKRPCRKLPQMEARRQSLISLPLSNHLGASG